MVKEPKFPKGWRKSRERMFDAVKYVNKHQDKILTIASQDDKNWNVRLIDGKGMDLIKGKEITLVGTEYDAKQHAVCLVSKDYTECTKKHGIKPAEQLYLK